MESNIPQKLYHGSEMNFSKIFKKKKDYRGFFDNRPVDVDFAIQVPLLEDLEFFGPTCFTYVGVVKRDKS